MQTLKKLLRLLIREEIGRNFHTLDNDPYSYNDYPGMEINVYADANGKKWFAQVTCLFDDKLSTPLNSFNSEIDANNFARQSAEQINRIRLANNIDTDTPTINDID